jgi:hypothetical protein
MLNHTGHDNCETLAFSSYEILIRNGNIVELDIRGSYCVGQRKNSLFPDRLSELTT